MANSLHHVVKYRIQKLRGGFIGEGKRAPSPPAGVWGVFGAPLAGAPPQSKTNLVHFGRHGT